MRKLVLEGKRDPAILFKARSLVQHLPQKDYVGEVKAVHAFVRDHIRYVRDPRGVETLTEPDKLLTIRQGDCDDKATLVATLLEALGHPTRFVAVGFQAGRFSHVFAQTKIGTKWVTLETTEPWPVGREGPTPANRMIIHN